MEEMVFWKEVGAVIDNTNVKCLKRVVIPILSDQEIETEAQKEFPIIYPDAFWNTDKPMSETEWMEGKRRIYVLGYKAFQERLIGGEGL